MSRDFRKLKVFALADALVVSVYRSTRGFPVEERFGLQSQLRRAAVSVSANIVEGSARRTLREYVHFLATSVASATEVRYLVGLAARLGFIDVEAARPLENRYGDLIRALQSMIVALERRPEA